MASFESSYTWSSQEPERKERRLPDPWACCGRLHALKARVTDRCLSAPTVSTQQGLKWIPSEGGWKWQTWAGLIKGSSKIQGINSVGLGRHGYSLKPYTKRESLRWWHIKLSASWRFSKSHSPRIFPGNCATPRTLDRISCSPVSDVNIKLIIWHICKNLQAFWWCFPGRQAY